MQEGNRYRFKPGWTTVLTIACVLSGSVWLWKDVLEERVIPKGWAVVEPGMIYRSGQLSSTLVKDMLIRHKIGVVIALNAAAPGDRDCQAEVDAARELGIRHVRFPLSGNGTGDVNNYAAAMIELVRATKQGRPVLVHCSAGVMRTGGIVTLYRLLVERRSASFVMAELRRHGWNPKSTALPLYINNHVAELGRMLLDSGVIEDVPDPVPVLPI
jgi:hypothetical protein